MQATEMAIEYEGQGETGVLSQRAQELDDVVSRQRPMFYSKAFRYLGNAPDAEDAVQDAVLSAYKHLSQFRGQARMSSWLTAIVINVARMELRRRRVIHLSLEEQQSEEGLPLSERLADSKPNPEQAFFSSEAESRFLNAVNQLSPAMRRAFQLRDIDGLTTREAALALGVPEGTLKTQLARGRAKLARAMRLKPGRQSARSHEEFAW